MSAVPVPNPDPVRKLEQYPDVIASLTAKFLGHAKKPPAPIQIDPAVLAGVQQQVLAFADTLFDPTDVIEVRTVPAGRSTWHLVHELPQHIPDLIQRNKADQHVYIGANPRPSVGAKGDTCIVLARCLFVDFDNGTTLEQARQRIADAGLPPPTLTLLSGHGVHAYWRLTEPLADMVRFTALQKRLAAKLGGDPKIFNPERLMRLPGFTNHKAPVAQSQLVESDPNRRYALAAFVAVLPPASPSRTPAHKPAVVSLNVSEHERVHRYMAYLATLPDAISGEDGHGKTLRAACEGVRFDLSDEQIMHGLRWFNEHKTGGVLWTEKELRHKLESARTKAAEEAGVRLAAVPPTGKRRKLDAEGVAALVADCHFFLHNGVPCVTYRNGQGRWVVEQVNTPDFNSEILRRQCKQSSLAPSVEETKQIQRSLEGHTRNDGTEEQIYRRIAWLENGTKLLIDLCDAENQIAVVTAEGVTVIKPDKPPVHFAKGAYAGSLPVPDLAGEISELEGFLNVKLPHRKLGVAALLGSFMPTGQIPPLVLFGEKGTGKSKAAEILQRLRDPQVHPAGQYESEASLPTSETDMAVAAGYSGGLLSYNNLSTMSREQADRLCRMVGGARLDTRLYYTNAGLCRFDARVWLILGGICDEMFSREDFRERAILLHLQPFAPGRRKSDAVYYAEFEAARPRIFGAILKAIAAAIHNLPTTAETDFRMSSFVRWVTAAESACGWAPKAFVDAYERDRREADALVLSENPVAQAIIRLLERNPKGWSGTTTDLLREFDREGSWQLPPHLRNSAVGVGKALVDIVPSLRNIGIYYARPNGRSGRGRVTHLSRTPINLPPSR